jgi:Peptidase inhibitor I9
MKLAARLIPPLLFALAACGDRGPKAPLYSCSSVDTTCVKGRYTVVFKDSVSDPGGVTGQLAKEYSFAPKSQWSGGMKGFSAELSEKTVDKIRHNPRVAYVRQGDVAQAY